MHAHHACHARHACQCMSCMSCNSSNRKLALSMRFFNTGISKVKSGVECLVRHFLCPVLLQPNFLHAAQARQKRPEQGPRISESRQVQTESALLSGCLALAVLPSSGGSALASIACGGLTAPAACLEASRRASVPRSRQKSRLRFGRGWSARIIYLYYDCCYIMIVRSGASELEARSR